MMTHDEMIAVIQAHKDGQRIQCREFSEDKWESANSGSLDNTWNFDKYEFRIAPAPQPPVRTKLPASAFPVGTMIKHPTQKSYLLVIQQINNFEVLTMNTADNSIGPNSTVAFMNSQRRLPGEQEWRPCFELVQPEA